MSNYPNDYDAKYYVYCFENKINGKLYIGKTNNLRDRYNHHCKANGDCPFFHNAMRKYSIDGFYFWVIESFDTEIDALNAEVCYIKQCCSNDKKYGYNLTIGGDGISGYHHSDENKLKMSKALRGRVPTNKGKKASEDTKRKLSLSHIGKPGYWTGKKLLDEHRKNLSQSHIGLVGGMIGKHHTEQTKKKMSESHKGKESCRRLKLSKDMIKKIEMLYNTGNYSYAQLANQFGVGSTTIYRIVKKLSYFNTCEEQNE